MKCAADHTQETNQKKLNLELNIIPLSFFNFNFLQSQLESYIHFNSELLDFKNVQNSS